MLEIFILSLSLWEMLAFFEKLIIMTIVIHLCMCHVILVYSFYQEKIFLTWI